MRLVLSLVPLMVVGVAATAQRPLPPVAVAHDAWERCALEQALAAWPRIADDNAVVEHARVACGAQAQAFANLYVEQRFPTYPAGVTTRAERIEVAIARFWPGHAETVLRYLPEARRRGITRVEMRYRRD